MARRSTGMTDLTRFVEAQANSWQAAIGELRVGRKSSHWMWYIFPQIAGLGHSPTARFYAIRDTDEARAYLADPVLGTRLVTASEAVLAWAGRRSAEAMLGGIDAVKLRSSMTLFEAIGSDGVAPVFAEVLNAFYDGERDAATLRLIA